MKGSLKQDGIEVVGVDAPSRDDLKRELDHYVAQYVQDGPVEVWIDGEFLGVVRKDRRKDNSRGG